MRDILFRGKRVDNSEWVYGFLVEALNCVTDKSETFIIEQDATYFTYGEFACAVEVKLETVGQFTGLCDKNGKKIFEGDILLKGFEKVLVKWNANQCRWGIYSNNYEICGFNESTQGYFEVIDNKWDNPEFLEVEQ